MKKKFLYFIFFVFFSLIFLITFDLTDFDSKFVNRSTFHIDVKNLDSKYTKRLFTKLRLYYLETYKILNKNSYEKRWGIEDPKSRIEIEAERALSNSVDSGCRFPVGAFAVSKGEMKHDQKQVVRSTLNSIISRWTDNLYTVANDKNFAERVG